MRGVLYGVLKCMVYEPSRKKETLHALFNLIKYLREQSEIKVWHFYAKTLLILTDVVSIFQIAWTDEVNFSISSSSRNGLNYSIRQLLKCECMLPSILLNSTCCLWTFKILDGQ